MGVDLNLMAEVRVADKWKLHPMEFTISRNRDLFAVLTGYNDPPELMKPVAAFTPLRGLPEDLSEDLSELRRIQQEDSHATGGWNWLYARELLEFPWHQLRVTHVFHPNQSRELGYLVSHEPDGTYSESYADFVGPEWMEEILPRIRSIGPPDDVRIIYYLDW
jgi:hypothetical protein